MNSQGHAKVNYEARGILQAPGGIPLRCPGTIEDVQDRQSVQGAALEQGFFRGAWETGNVKYVFPTNDYSVISLLLHHCPV